MSAASALEFALIAPPFVLSMMTIFDVAINSYFLHVIDGAAQVASRQIMTGTVNSATTSQTAFKTLVCNQLTVMVRCSDVTVSVTKLTSSFYELTQYHGGTNFTLKVPGQSGVPVNYCPGGPGDYVVVQIVYPTIQIIPIASFGSLLYGNTVSSNFAIRNEPFAGATSSSGC